MADEENPYARPSATVATPPGVPRITVTPAGTEENPYARPPPSKDVQLGREQTGMSWPAWLGQSALDFGIGAGNTGTFGLDVRRDAISGWIAGDYPSYSAGVEAETAKLAKARERSPVATTAGNITGGVASGIAGGAPGLGVRMAARFGASPAARIAGFGTEAGIQGAAQGAGHTYSGEVGDYVANAAKGAGVAAAIGGPLGAAVSRSAVAQRAGDPRTGLPIRQPTEAELLARSNNGYQVLSQIPVTYPGSHLQGALSGAESQMMRQNVAPEQAQTVFRILERVRNHPGSISPAQVDGIRQSLNNMKNVPTVGSEKAGVAAAILRDALDDMIQNGAQAASNPALARQAAQWVQQARGDRAAMFRSQQLTAPAENAAARQAATGTPAGEQLVTKGLKLGERKGSDYPNQRGWIDEERARVAAAITPTFPEKAAKFGADYFSRDIPALVGGKAVADAMRGWSARGVENRWNEAAAAMRGRSPSYERALQGAVPVAGPGMGRTGQGVVGAGTAELGTPYDDGREALVPSMLRQLAY